MGWSQGLAELPVLPFSGGMLRPWGPDDANHLAAAWADPEVARWNAVPPEATVATAAHWIAGQAGRLQQRLSIDLVIETNHGVVGEVGLSGFKTDPNDPTSTGAFIGYWLLEAARGQGVATNAVRRFVTWSHNELAIQTVVARCHEMNPASQAVAERCGFVHEANDPSQNQLWVSRTRGS